jgi:hypothetical protein
MPVLEVIPRGHVMRELITEIARLTNEMAGLRATPAVPQGRSVWLLFREDDESDAVMMYFEKPDETGFKDRFKLREFVLVERATTAPAPAAGILDRARWGGQVVNLMRLAEAADKAVASMTVPAPEAGSESKIVIDVGPGGSGGGPAEAAPAPAQEPVTVTLKDEEIADIQDRLVAVSGYVADQDDRAAQAILKGTLKMLAALRAKGQS